jgi:hypothetical protein
MPKDADSTPAVLVAPTSPPPAGPSGAPVPPPTAATTTAAGLDDELRRRTETVVFQRKGPVLGKRTIIKSEHYAHGVNPAQRCIYFLTLSFLSSLTTHNSCDILDE